MDETPAWGTPSAFQDPVATASPRLIGRLTRGPGAGAAQHRQGRDNGRPLGPGDRDLVVTAAGQQLRVSLEAGRHEPLSGPVGRIVRQRRREIIEAAEAHGASRVRVFGSVARGEDRADSDVDLLVDLPPGLGLLGYARLLDQLEQVIDGLKVDLVPAADLKPEIRARVEREAIPL